MKPTLAPAGQRTVLYQIRQGSIPVDLDFTVQPAHAGQELKGILEITASSWIIPGTPRRIPLQARHQVTRGFFNTFFTLAIIPEVDVRVTPAPRASTRSSPAFRVTIILLIAFVIIGAALLRLLPKL